ncbi:MULTISPECIES: Sec-independent protein translocase protein TatB [unclassified Gordonia (in: high G+C Gram-positive bacteria)]|uniref:Sec-independent protein translocase protein TatB n=1 Tax=unclassified Gordonia (in: high G+C Gram-positive bacteria) TaxID=2657482 RepID=UPI000F9AA48F|nr:MAG: Sec-independent protein translocase subunit TatB [Gordonia sp. (in: high G+C Gram-positive bacteria)]
MFANLGWGEILILIAAGLIILGPERLPGAISSSLSWFRKARDYVTGATADLRKELGPEFDDLREPLQQLNELRSTSPRALVTKHLLGGDDSLLDPKTYTDLADEGERSTPGTAQDGTGRVDRGDDAGESADTTAGERTTGAHHSAADWEAT